MNARATWAALLIAVLAMLLPAAARADGRAYVAGAVEGEPSVMRPLSQQHQLAVLLHREGTEHLLIAISVDLRAHDKHAFWLFPVPSRPEDIVIDLTGSFPVLRGKDMSRASRFGLVYNCTVQCGLAIYPPIGAWVAILPAIQSRTARAPTPHDGNVEKYGLRAERLAATSTELLINLLTERGLEMAREELALFEPYCSEEYSLILTRILSKQELRWQFPADAWEWWPRESRRPALYVRFPADELFYPMRPTAGYGDERIPVDIVVLGKVRARADQQMLEYGRCHRWREASVAWDQFPEPMQAAAEPGAPLVYTRLYWRWTPAKAFTSDLTFEPMGAAAARYELILGRLFSGVLAWVVFFGSFAVLLFVTGGLCGLIYFGRWWRFAFLGLVGILSVPIMVRLTRGRLIAGRNPSRRSFPFVYGLTFLGIFIGLNVGFTLLLRALLRV